MSARAKPTTAEPEEEDGLNALQAFLKEIDPSDGKKVDGLSKAGFDRLREMSLVGVADLAVMATNDLTDVIGGEAEVARALGQLARDRVHIGQFESAATLAEREEMWRRITTGSAALDALLGGGVPTSAITEGFGIFAAGKTELGLQLAVNVQLPISKGGLSEEGAPSDVFWIDTEKTFRASRIAQMAKAQGLDPKEVLPHIHVAQAVNASHQQLLLDVVRKAIVEKNLNPKLIVVDSLTAHFRAEFAGRGTLAPRQNQLNDHLHRLLRYSEAWGAAVYVTNQAMADPSVMFGDPIRPVGGNIVGHNCTYRVYLRKSKAPRRIAKLVDSPDLPEAEAVFELLEEGIRDSSDAKKRAGADKPDD